VRALVYCLIAIAAATAAVTLAGFNVDLALAGMFYDPADGRFLGHKVEFAGLLRDNGRVAIATCAGCIVLAAAKHLPWRLPNLPWRTALVLTLALLLGPGLLVNGILKEHWGRPRPIEIVPFGGPKSYVNWWDPRGTCEQNCSFVSGEAASAAWMFGPAMFVPAPWRGLALTAAAVFTALTGALRLSVGGHFFSDVLFGALSTMLILLGMRALIDPPLAKFQHSRNGRADRPDDSSRAQPIV
jgi:membrane-associated phospholipid phosphatase